MDLAAVVAVQVLYAVASLVIVSAGLAVIFGMMRVINLAHGEFMMLGARLMTRIIPKMTASPAETITRLATA